MDIETLKKKYDIDSTLEKREELEKKLENIEGLNEDISSLSEQLNYYTTLSDTMTQFLRYLQEYEEAEKLQNESVEPDLLELAREEVVTLEKNLSKLDDKIANLLIEREFHDKDDSRSVILEIRAGAGGQEASLFAANLFDMYKAYATKQGWIVQIIDSNVSDTGGYREVIAHIQGSNVYKRLKYESGVHRVQRVPVTESSGRIHTSTATVAIMPEALEIDVEIKPEELRIDVMRASGAGGQCVNRTDSAVRITHIPTGIVVSCQETKHQAQNKEKAMATLRSRLYEKQIREEESKRSDLRASQIGGAMRAEKIRTYNFPQNRITDHRIKKSWHNLDAVLYGELDEIIDDVTRGIQLSIIGNAE